MPKESRTYREFAASIIETLESLDIPYAIGGTLPAAPMVKRAAADIDISIVLPSSDVMCFVEAIQNLGYYVLVDSITDSMITKLPFNIIDATSGYKADLFLVEPTPLEESILERRRRVAYDPATNATALLYSPEDVIIYKLKYFMMDSHKNICATLPLCLSCKAWRWITITSRTGHTSSAR